MEVAVFLDVLFKISFYDFAHLTQLPLRKIVFIAANEYAEFCERYGKYFDLVIAIDSNNNELNYQQSHQQLAKIVEECGCKNVKIVCCTEFNVLLAAKLREDFNLSGMKYEQALLFRDKLRMKDMLQDTEVKLPNYQRLDPVECKTPDLYFTKLSTQLGLPFIIKPTNSAGSEGVSKVCNFAQFQEALFSLENNVVYEAESFISGSLYHIDSIYQNGEAVFQVCAQYSYPNLEFLKGKSIISLPLPDESSISIRAKQMADIVHSRFGYNGSSHLEFFVTDDNALVFLEIGSRPPGGLITPLYATMFGINMLNWHLMVEFGISCPKQVDRLIQDYYMCIEIPLRSGTVTEIDLPRNMVGIYDLDWKVKIGDQIDDSKHALDYAAKGMIKTRNYQEACHDFNILLTNELYKVE